jgi:hypothetical protein
VLEDKCTNRPHSAALAAPRSSVHDGVDDLSCCASTRTADGATALDVAVRGAGVAVLASFVAQLALWCTEFLEMRELLRRVGQRLTRALLARPNVAPLRYKIALSDTVVLVPRDSQQRARRTATVCALVQRVESTVRRASRRRRAPVRRHRHSPRATFASTRRQRARTTAT